MHSRIERARTHIRENKAAYIGTAVGVVVGAAATVIVCKTRVQPDMVVAPKNENYALLNWKPIQTIEVYVEALGDPGNVVQDLTTGTIYASQGQAAKALGLNPGRVSEQIRGIRDHVNGHRFEVLGKAAVSQE